MQDRGGRLGLATASARAALAVLALLTVLPGTALAHPLGVPAIVGVSVPEAGTVVLRWQAAPDDIGALWRRVGADVPDGAAPTTAQQEEVGAGAALRAVVTEDLTPTADGCALTGVDATAVSRRGLTATWSCPPTATDTVTVRVALLTTVDARYRTLVHGSGAPDEPALATSAADTVTVDVTLGAPDRTELTPGAPQDATGADGRTTAPDSLLARVEERVLAAIDAPATGGGALLLALLVAVAAGALHGLAPGHGKAIAGAYLLGERGQPRHAVGLGAVVAGMHTSSTLVLGVVLLSARRAGGTARLEGWLGLVAGATVLVLGVVLVVRRLRGARGGAGATHHHPDHDGPAHHDDAEGHSHVVADVDPFTWRGLLALGAAGGLLPSPTALLVVITGFATDHLWTALALVAAFSIGLAGTVTAAGLAVLWGRDRVRRAGGAHPLAVRVAATLPLLGATAVLCVGAFLTARAATTLLT